MFYHQVEEELQKDFETKKAKRQRDFDGKVKELETDRETLANQKESV